MQHALEQSDCADFAEGALVAVSELVTNALVHAGSSVRVGVLVEGGGMRVEVADGSPHLPANREYADTSGTGRGLHLVQDLSDRWGAHRTSTGKVVWFEMRRAVADDPRSGRVGPVSSASPPPEAADAVSVELVDFPLLLHAAWQEHASALLRELLLMRLLDGDEATAFERHAQASDAMNVLFEQAPAPNLGDDPNAIMLSATEPRVTARSVRLSVPRDTVPHFAVLDAMLSEAVSLAGAGDMLVAPTQPEVRAFRGWVCDQVRLQATAAASPTPWSSQRPMEVRRDSASVGQGERPEIWSSDRLLLATNQDSVIVAASRPAAEFLGYEQGDLVGQRVLSIVPARYRQAHIAGTTMHLTNGRSPLLNRRITVPVVRADGSEVTVSLLVEPRLSPEEEKYFLAEFFPD